MSEETGGPAFPCDNIVERNEIGQLKGSEISSAGISTRDYFAAKAMQGMYAAGDVAEGCKLMPGISDEGHCLSVAQWAYLQADAMLEARAK